MPNLGALGVGQFFAHTLEEQPPPSWQLLEEHLASLAVIAAESSERFDARELEAGLCRVAPHWERSRRVRMSEMELRRLQLLRTEVQQECDATTRQRRETKSVRLQRDRVGFYRSPGTPPTGT